MHSSAFWPKHDSPFYPSLEAEFESNHHQYIKF